MNAISTVLNNILAVERAVFKATLEPSFTKLQTNTHAQFNTSFVICVRITIDQLLSDKQQRQNCYRHLHYFR